MCGYHTSSRSTNLCQREEWPVHLSYWSSHSCWIFLEHGASVKSASGEHNCCWWLSWLCVCNSVMLLLLAADEDNLKWCIHVQSLQPHSTSVNTDIMCSGHKQNLLFCQLLGCKWHQRFLYFCKDAASPTDRTYWGFLVSHGKTIQGVVRETTQNKMY